MSSSSIAELVGPMLRRGKDTVETSSLNASYYFLYFSAHWCGPCRMFTPMLTQVYADLKSNKNIEVIFVSSDRDEPSFEEYYGSMPWLALPFSDRDRKAALSRLFKVQGIPTLVVLDDKGELCTTDGRSEVMEDPTGENLPWRPPTLRDSLSDAEFVDKSGAKKTFADFAGKTLGLYFSAHWCPPCQRFTPELARVYEELKAAGKDFEVLFISSDNSEGEFNEYLGHMPWFALSFSDRARKAKLSKVFDVEGIPTLIILDSELNVINKDGRSGVSSKGAAGFPWNPPLVGDLDEDDPSDLNELPCVVVLMEDVEPEDQDVIASELLTVASEASEADKAAHRPRSFGFYYSKVPNNVGQQIRQLTKLGAPKAGKANLVLLDLGDNGGYYSPQDAAAPVTAESVRALLDGYRNKSLPRKQAGR